MTETKVDGRKTRWLNYTPEQKAAATEKMQAGRKKKTQEEPSTQAANYGMST